MERGEEEYGSAKPLFDGVVFAIIRSDELDADRMSLVGGTGPVLQVPLLVANS